MIIVVFLGGHSAKEKHKSSNSRSGCQKTERYLNHPIPLPECDTPVPLRSKICSYCSCEAGLHFSSTYNLKRPLENPLVFLYSCLYSCSRFRLRQLCKPGIRLSASEDIFLFKDFLVHCLLFLESQPRKPFIYLAP